MKKKDYTGYMWPCVSPHAIGLYSTMIKTYTQMHLYVFIYVYIYTLPYL